MSKSMQESLNEALSAAVDGEAEELELHRVLNAADKDPELRAKWERMHLIGSIVRGETTRPNTEGRVLDIDDDPADEPMLSDRPRYAGGSGRWVGPVTGVAVAAAVVVAVALDVVDGGEGVDGPLVAAQAPDSFNPSSGLASATSDPADALVDPDTPALAAVSELDPVPSKADLARAHDYLVQHAQHASSPTRGPGMPHVKVLTVSNTQDEAR